MQVESAFDTEAFYQSLTTSASFDEFYSAMYNNISSIILTIGYDTYSIMLRRFALASIVSFLIKLMYNFLVVYPFEIGCCRFYIPGRIHSSAFPDIHRFYRCT